MPLRHSAFNTMKSTKNHTGKQQLLSQWIVSTQSLIASALDQRMNLQPMPMAAPADSSSSAGIMNQMILEQALRTRNNMLFPSTFGCHLFNDGCLLDNYFIPGRHEEGPDIAMPLAVLRLATKCRKQEEALAAASALTFAHQKHHQRRIDSSILQMRSSGAPNSTHPMPLPNLLNVSKVPPPVGPLGRKIAITFEPPTALTTVTRPSSVPASTSMAMCYRQGGNDAVLSQHQSTGENSSGDKSAAGADTRRSDVLYSKVNQLKSYDCTCAIITRKNKGIPLSTHPSSCNVRKETNGVHIDQDALEALGLSCLERRMNKTPYVDASVFKDPSPDVVCTYRRGRGSSTEPFPEKLYRMLVESAKEGKEHIASFLSHGRAFGIHKPEEFVKEIMPKYFKSTRLSSFQRQLNIYGFGRINTGPDVGGYYHELFLRRRPALCIHISRVGVPQEGIKRKRGAKALQTTLDPYFYSTSPILLVGIEKA